MELVRLDKVKSNLTTEMAKLSEQAEQMLHLTEEHQELKLLYQKTEENYQTMLTVRFSIFSFFGPF